MYKEEKKNTIFQTICRKSYNNQAHTICAIDNKFQNEIITQLEFGFCFLEFEMVTSPF